jgi:LuxR family maltose regulon positive regulatory protein
MADELLTVPLIRTKLQPPRLPADLVRRRRLLDRLQAGLDRKLTLISAQAGAGKTTLLGQWLADAECPYPSAWLSLDEHDNDLIVFVSYLVGAIRTVIPDACEKTLGLLDAAQPPPLRVIATSLVNELDELTVALSSNKDDPTDSLKEGGRSQTGARSISRLILALDDYQVITDPAIHELMSILIRHLPRSVHLALTTRSDPPLPLPQLRARGEMTEFRFVDMRFTPQETDAFLQGAVGREVSAETASLLAEKAEGWIAGLRLAALSMRVLSDDKAFAQRFRGTSSALIVEYLLNEVLAQQSPEIQDFALRTSVLDRFCAPLCQVLTEIPAERSQQIIDRMAGANLFVVSLDEEGKWYRYHHLFRDLLRPRLAKQYGTTVVSELHARAGAWYAENGLIDEALDHLLAANDIAAAAGLVARHRTQMLNQARWSRLERWLRRFSPDVIDQYPDLLILKTWLLYHQNRYAELPASLERLEASLARVALAPDTLEHLQGEIDAVRSLLAYFAVDAQATIVHAQASLEKTRPDLWIVRSLARLTLAGALQMKGDLPGAYAAIYDGLAQEEGSSPAFKATLLVTTCNIHWIAADLQGLAQAAGQCIALSQGAESPEMSNYGHYHLGRARYQHNDLPDAERHFSTVARQPYVNYGDCFLYGACGLALTHQAQGRAQEARAAAQSAVDFMLETGNTTLLPQAQAFQAELALMQGNIATAGQWAAQLDSDPPLSPVYGIFSPHLTLVKVWLAKNTLASREQAGDLIGRLQTFFASIHNSRFLIETLALQALLSSAEGDESAALSALKQAITLAEPGGFIRLFVDLGPSIARLLDQLRDQGEAPAYIARILAAFDTSDAALAAEGGRASRAEDRSLVDPLTPRELEVLALLARHLTNRQIAEELFISPVTVKTHTLRIYRKLDVRGRQHAVAKARELGLLPSNVL